MSEPNTEKNIKDQVNSYVILMILQRLDDKHPGLIKDILNGVKADFSASKEQTGEHPMVSSIFNETIKFLERANSKNNS